MQANANANTPSFFECFKEEFSFSDILKGIKILLSSLMHAFAQGVSFVILSGVTFVLSKTVLGEVIVPGLAKVFVGLAQAFLPAILAPYAGSLILGGFVAFWGLSFLVWKLDNMSDRKNHGAEAVGPKVQSASLGLTAAYFIGAWMAPAVLLYVGSSHGVALKTGLISMGAMSALVAGAINLVARTKEFVAHFFLRMAQKEQAIAALKGSVKAKDGLLKKMDAEDSNEILLEHDVSYSQGPAQLQYAQQQQLGEQDASKTERSKERKETNFDSSKVKTQRQHKK